MPTMKRLSGWQPIAVVVSAIWVIGLCGYQQNDKIKYSTWMAETEQEACQYRRQVTPATDCSQAFYNGYDRAWAISPSFWNILFGSLITLPLLWFPILLTVKTITWIRAGFAKPKTDQSPSSGYSSHC